MFNHFVLSRSILGGVYSIKIEPILSFLPGDVVLFQNMI